MVTIVAVGWGNLIKAENAPLRDEEEASRVFDTRLVLRFLSA
jgi:hypothetical protein